MVNDKDAVATSNKKALIIAISDYEQGFEYLDFCKNDGQEMFKTLKDLEYYISPNFNKIGNIDSQELRNTIFEFFDNDKNKASDTLIFYYSGHSIPDSQGDIYFASSDTHPNFPFKKGFNFSDLTKVINSCSASIVAILDCCYSGAAELHKGNEDDMALVGTSQIDKMSQVVNENEGKYILCAGQKYEKAYRARKVNHSVYSYYLLNGLKGNKNAVDNNGNVTPESLDKYIVQEFRKLPPNEKPLQKPVRKVEASGEIVLAEYPHLKKNYSSIVKATRTETYKAVAMWGSKGSGDGQFESPRGMTVNHREVYVVDSDNNRIQKFDNNGRFVIKWGSSPRFSKVKNLAIDATAAALMTAIIPGAATLTSIPGAAPRYIVAYLFNRKKFPKHYKFYYLSGIAIDSDNVNIYVTDSNNHRIQKFDNNGRFIIKWGSEGNGDGQFNTPSGIAVDSSGNVYVADSENHRIQKFDSHDMFIRKWGSYGSGDGKFKYPIGIAVDSSGNVYVADSENHRIQKFDSHGKFVTKWGSIGSEDGQFSSPTNIAVDSKGYVYVVDRANQRIQKFDSDGKFVTEWSYISTKTKKLFCPELISVDNSGNVYTYDSISNQIVKFSLQQ